MFIDEKVVKCMFNLLLKTILESDIVTISECDPIFILLTMLNPN